MLLQNWSLRCLHQEVGEKEKDEQKSKEASATRRAADFFCSGRRVRAGLSASSSADDADSVHDTCAAATGIWNVSSVDGLHSATDGIDVLPKLS
jgi:hypothetical protein